MLLLKTCKALNGLLCADVRLRNFSLTPIHSKASSLKWWRWWWQYRQCDDFEDDFERQCWCFVNTCRTCVQSSVNSHTMLSLQWHQWRLIISCIRINTACLTVSYQLSMMIRLSRRPHIMLQLRQISSQWAQVHNQPLFAAHLLSGFVLLSLFSSLQHCHLADHREDHCDLNYIHSLFLGPWLKYEHETTTTTVAAAATTTMAITNLNLCTIVLYRFICILFYCHYCMALHCIATIEIAIVSAQHSCMTSFSTLFIYYGIEQFAGNLGH